MRFLILLGIPAIVLFRCGGEAPPLAGGTSTGSETTNGLVATAIMADSTPAANAAVRLRPAGYLAETPLPALRKRMVSRADAITDSRGRFFLDSISPGEYRIEVNDRESTAILLTCVVDESSDSVVDLGTAVLQRFATLSGAVRAAGSLPPASVGVFGLERRAAVDSGTGGWRIDDLPAGDFRLRIEPESDEYGAAVIDAPYVSAGDSASLDTTTLVSYTGEDYSAWTYSRAVRINTTASGADVTDDVHNFPLLLRLDSAALDFAQTAPDGRDIRFSKSDGTPLRYEIDFWDAYFGHAAVWVLMDTVRGNDSTQSITMYWGGPADAPDFSSPSAVFDTANGHAMVWHVNETGAGDLGVIRDVTVNGVHGQSNMPGRPYSVAGRIGGAMSLGYPANHIDTVTMHASRSRAIAFRQASFTISLWARRYQGGYAIVYAPGYAYRPQLLDHQTLSLTNQNDSHAFISRADAVGDPAGWNLYHAVVNRSDNTVSFYTNGKAIGTESIADTLGALKSAGLFAVIGDARVDLDEIRMSAVARNEGWIQLCHVSQREGADVVSFR